MEDTAYSIWLSRVNRIATHYKINPEDLLTMLYVNDSDFDYRELYNCYERFAFYNRFLKERSENAETK